MEEDAERNSSLDIDPGWYPGQLETSSAAPTAAGAPTVLQKLQKWGDYESVGAQVWPTRFVPMKTPLSQHILANWSLPEQPKFRLTVSELVADQHAQGRRIGLILDLSNHDCLYTDDIPSDVEYKHIQLVAKELPPQEFVDAVVAAAGEFWQRKPDHHIAIHCAYGFNRTGFVVASYLIEVCGLTVEDALQSFSAARPPGVKHEAFRAELYARYSRNRCGLSSLGSADDNSSFGCSPNIRDLHLLEPSLYRRSPLSLGQGDSQTPPPQLHLLDGGQPCAAQLAGLSPVPAPHLMGRSPGPEAAPRSEQGAAAGSEAEAAPEAASSSPEQRASPLPAPPSSSCGPSQLALSGHEAELPSLAGGSSRTSCSQHDGSLAAGAGRDYGENESLGVSERIILQSFRDRSSPRADGTSTPSKGEAAGRFKRKSLSDIQWGDVGDVDGGPVEQLGGLALK